MDSRDGQLRERLKERFVERLQAWPFSPPKPKEIDYLASQLVEEVLGLLRMSHGALTRPRHQPRARTGG